MKATKTALSASPNESYLMRAIESGSRRATRNDGERRRACGDMSAKRVNSMLSKISNQRLRFNVKKAIQLYAMYHQSDATMTHISRLLFRRGDTENSRERIKEELMERSKRYYSKVQRRRSLNERVHATTDLLCRMYNRKFIGQVIKLFSSCLMVGNSTTTDAEEREARVPIIACQDERDIDALISACQRENKFPFRLVPPCIRSEFEAMCNVPFKTSHRK